MSVRMVQKLDEVRYAELKIYMHKRYVHGEDRCLKTVSAVLNVLVNWKWGKRPPEQHYESRNGVILKNKGNIGGFRGD